MSPEVKRLVAQMEAEIDRNARASMGIPSDWVYRDVPWCDRASWNGLLAILGEDDHRLIAHSQRANGAENRGQMFVSPTGMANLFAYHRGRCN